jgi:hypothetical protein
MPFDSVVSIGGQSFVDGVWRLLQPALQYLTHPFPVSVPGLTNTWVRVRSITPQVSGNLSAVFALKVELEARGELLMTTSVRAGLLRLRLGTVEIDLPQLEGNFQLPTGRENIINVTLPPMTGTLQLPAPPRTQTITLRPENDQTATAMLPGTPGTLKVLPNRVTIQFPDRLGDLGLPLPAVVPVPIDLGPMTFTVTLGFNPRSPVDAGSAFGLLLEVFSSATPRVEAPVTAERIRSSIRDKLNQLLAQLPGAPLLPQPIDDLSDDQLLVVISDLMNAVQAAIRNEIMTPFSSLTLTARTGRLIFPRPGAGSPCDVALLPTEAQARISLLESGPVLQIGFARTGVSQPPFDFHDFTPSGAADVEVKIGNLFLRELLCCVVGKLPNFTFHQPAAPFDPESDCCKWSGVTLELWPLVLSGALELCIEGSPGMPKQVMLNGDFRQNTELLNISASFRLPLGLHLNEVAAVTGLRLAGTPQV